MQVLRRATPGGPPVDEPAQAEMTRPRRRPRLLLMWDVGVAAIAAALMLAWGGLQEGDPGAVLLVVGALLVLGPLALHACGGYDAAHRPLGNAPEEIGRLAMIAGGLFWAITAGAVLLGEAVGLRVLVAGWAMLTTGWFLGRILQRVHLVHSPQNAIVLGTGPMAVRVVEIAQRHPEHGIRVVGFVDDEPLGLPPGTPPVLGGLDELEFHLRRGGVKRLIVAFPNSLDDRAMADLLKLSTPHGIRVEVVPRLWELAGHDTGLGALGNLTLIEMTPIRPHIVRTAVKRGFDVVAAGLGLLLASPVLAAVAVAVRIDSPGPALFRQTRIGRDGRPFEILKFRSMYVDADAGDGAAGRALEADAGALGLDTPVSDLVAELKREHDPRITAVGRFIRRTSLDELPQLWNVLVGDMSVIGPRPLRPFEARSLTAWQQQRHLVRPGITGIWQVLGRSDVQWNERMEMDYSYARNCSLRQDVRVLARTLTVVLSGKGSR